MQDMQGAPAPDQGQPAPQGPQGAESAGGATKLLADSFSNLSQLSDLFSKSNVITDTDRQKLGQILSQIQDLAEGLGQPSGEDAEAPQGPAPKGPMPMNAAPGAMPGGR